MMLRAAVCRNDACGHMGLWAPCTGPHGKARELCALVRVRKPWNTRSGGKSQRQPHTLDPDPETEPISTLHTLIERSLLADGLEVQKQLFVCTILQKETVSVSARLH